MANVKSTPTQEITTILRALVSMPTVSADLPANIDAIAWLKRRLIGLPLYITEVEFFGRPSLIISTIPGKHQALWLVAHIDVVPARPESFVARVVGDKFFGRGVFDMKFALAAYLHLLHELGDNLSKYDFAVVVTTDEEVGGASMENLIDSGYSCDAAIIPDAGTNWVVERAAKGYGQYRVTSNGQSAHGSRPWLGRNAIVQLITYLQALRGNFPTEPCSTTDHNHNSFSIGIIRGGMVANQIPDFAEAELDIRFLPGYSSDQFEKMLSTIGEHYPGITVEEIMMCEVSVTDPNNPYVRKFTQIMAHQLGIEPKFVLSHGSSDARFLHAKGIPTILTRPDGDGQHGDREWVSVEGMGQFYDILRAYMEQVALVGAPPIGNPT